MRGMQLRSELLEDRWLLSIGERHELAPVATASDSFIEESSVPEAGDLSASQFASLAPAGAFIYLSEESAAIESAAANDTLVFRMEANQSLAVRVQSTSGLIPQVTLQGPPDDNELQSNSSPDSSVPALLPFRRTQAGDYSLVVSSVNGTTGSYQLEILLNGIFEAEQSARGDNSTPETAESLDMVFSQLGVTGAERAAVVGFAPATFQTIYTANMDVDPHWNLEGGPGGWEFATPQGLGSDPTVAVTGEHVIGYGLTTRLAPLPPRLFATTPRINLGEAGRIRLSYYEWLVSPSGGAVIEANTSQGDWAEVWGLTNSQFDRAWSQRTIDLPSHFAGHRDFQLRWGQGPYGQSIPSGWNIDDVVVSAELPSSADWYRFALNDRHAATITLASHGEGGVLVDLYDSTGTVLLARGVGSDPRQQSIHNFVDQTSNNLPDEMLVRVRAFNTDYSLVVTRDGDLSNSDHHQSEKAQVLVPTNDGDIMVSGTLTLRAPTYSTEVEPNDNHSGSVFSADLSLANDLSNSLRGVGNDRYAVSLTGSIASGTVDDLDFFLVRAKPGDQLTVNLFGASSNSGTLDDPFLWLLGTGGEILDLNDDVDGSTLDARITFNQFGNTGTYYIVADRSSSLSSGTYRLNVVLTTNQIMRDVSSDWYEIDGSIGDHISIALSTPGDDDGAPDNRLSPRINIITPDGLPVAGGTSYQHDVTQNGVYRVQVITDALITGSYLLEARGVSPQQRPFSIVATNIESRIYSSLPPDLIVTFSDAVDLTSLSVSDILFNGQTPTNIEIVDGRRIAFAVTEHLRQGSNTVSIAAGAVEDLQNTPLRAFLAEFQFDSIAPRLVSLSLPPNETIPAGPLTLSLEFNEGLEVDQIDQSDLRLLSDRGTVIVPSAIRFDQETFVLHVDYPHLVDGRYRLLLRSRPTSFVDLAANLLDGEPAEEPGDLSGDGFAGGDFVRDFEVDSDSIALGALMSPILPRSIIGLEAKAQSYVTSEQDVDQFTIDLAADDVLAVVLRPNSQLQASLSLLDPTTTVVAAGIAAGAGRPLTLPAIRAPISGTYTIRVSGEAGSLGAFELLAGQGVTFEPEESGGANNDTFMTATSLDPVFVAAGTDSSAERAVVRGISDFNLQPIVSTNSTWRYHHEIEPPEVGWASVYFDDLDWRVGKAEFGYGDGDEMTELETGPFGETIIVTSYFRQAIVLERDLARYATLRSVMVYDDGVAYYFNGLEFYRDLLNTNAGHTDFASGSSSQTTFTRSYALPNLPTNALHMGANTIAGEVHQASLGSSDVSFSLRMELLAPARPYDDWYRFSLNDGQTTSLWLEQLSGINGVMRLYAADGTTLLATASVANGLGRSIQGFVDTTTDGQVTEYLVRITGSNVHYNLAVARDAVVETEPNGLFATAQWAPTAYGRIENRIEGTANVITNFAGMNSESTLCGCEPPDTHVAVGKDHVVEVVNTAVQVYDKLGNRVGAPRELTQFFQPSVVQGNLFDFDPVVAYDELADRWVVAALIAVSGSADESDLLYAVSDSGDPSAGWSEQHRIDFGGVSPGLFADYPKIGWNADAHVITLNMFSPFSFDHVDVVVIEKTSVIDRNATTIDSRILSRDETSFTLAAAVMHDALPGDPLWFVEETEYGGGTSVRVVRLDDPLGVNPIFRDFELPVTAYALPPNAPQPEGFAFNTNDSRILNAAWRNNRLFAAHTVGINSQAVVRWYEFDTALLQPSLVQQVTMTGGAGVHRYYPAIDVNRAGDVGITFLQSSSSEHVSMYVSGQSHEAADGSYDRPALVRAGNEPYPGSRGGDYAGIGVDPVTDTFWAANEVSLAGSPNPLWSTWIGEFAVAPINDEDWYWIPVNAGDEVRISVTTARLGALYEETELISDLHVYSPAGLPIEVELDRTDPHAVRLTFHADVAGNYRMRVSGLQNTAGSYVFAAMGTTATRPAPFVIDMDPDDGMVVAALPDRILLRFSEGFRNSTLTSSAFRIDGLVVSSAQFVDPVTVALGLPTNLVRRSGIYAIEASPGALTGVSGQPSSHFSGTITVDDQGPHILNVVWNYQSETEADFLPTDNLQISMQFDEPLFTLASARRGLRTPGTDDIILILLSSNTKYRPVSMEYDFSTRTVRAEFPTRLPEGEYELQVLSGDGAFEDLVGNDLDGEPHTSGSEFPTGNGTPGGHYTKRITLDYKTEQINDFVAVGPLSAMAYESLQSGFLQFAGDIDRFVVGMYAGETLAVRVTPTSPTAFVVVNGQSSATPGAPVIVAHAASSDGDVTWSISGSENTAYRVELDRNLVQAGMFPQVGGSSRSNITPSKLAVGDTARFVVHGNISPEYNEQVLLGENFANGLNGFSINNQGGGTTGLWHLSTGRRNDNLPFHSSPASLYFGRQETATSGGNYDAGHVAGTVTSGPISIPVDGESILSFSHFLDRESSILFDVAEVLVDDGTTRTVLLSTSLRTLANTGGAWSRISASLEEYRGKTVRIVYSFDSVDEITNDFEGWFVDDIAIVNRVVQRPGLSQFYVELQDYVGQQVDVILRGEEGASFVDEQLSLWGPDGSRLASAIAVPDGDVSTTFDLAILNQSIAPTTAGLHYLSLRTFVAGEFTITVTARSQLELEPNDESSDTLRSVTASTRMWGHADADFDTTDLVRLNLNARQPVVITRHLSRIDQGGIDQAPLATSWSALQSGLRSLSWPYVPNGVDMSSSLMVAAGAAGNLPFGIEAASGSGAYQLEFDFAVRNGDVNEDGLLRCDDLDRLIRATRGGASSAAADISGDGSVDLIDVNLWFALSAQTNLPFGQMYNAGDANLDGRVDSQDFLMWDAHRFSTDATWCSGDFNSDTVVDVADFNLWNLNRFASPNAAEAEVVANHHRRVPRAAGLATSDSNKILSDDLMLGSRQSSSGIIASPWVVMTPDERPRRSYDGIRTRQFALPAFRHTFDGLAEFLKQGATKEVLDEDSDRLLACWRDNVDFVMKL